MSKDKDKDKDNTDRLINVAVVGAGSGVAPRHVASFIPEIGARVVAGVEIVDRLRGELQRRFGFPMFDSMAELVEAQKVGRAPRIDLAVICVPDAFHVEAVVEAFSHGWNVLCEKPMADGAEQARQLYRRAQQRGLYLGHALQRRFMTPQVDRIVAEDVIGKVRSVEFAWLRYAGMPASRKQLRSRGGVLADLGVHGLSHVLPQFGATPPTRVTAWASSDMSGALVEDDAFVVVDFEGGGWVKLTVSFDRTLAPQGDDRIAMTIVGVKGEIDVPLLTGHTAEQADALRPELRVRSNGRVDVRTLDRLRTTEECHLLQARHVVGAVRARRPASDNEVRRELRVVGVLDAAYRSIDDGNRPVALG